ncbi:MAG: response regulator [Verrucomicrobia bacterium]|nr:response regulator [Verrucomicrobiota bacterium]
MFHRIIGEDIALQSIPADSALPIRADTGMIEQVLLNLVVNARDAMPKGGRLQIATNLEIVDSEAAAQITDAKPGPHVVLTVTDSGIGIPAEDLPHIFEPFFTTKEAGKGTGLGLATVYGIVKQHHAWLAVQSAPGEGTKFKIYFPAVNGQASSVPTSTLTQPLPRGSETLLVVEDERAVRQLVSNTLEHCGYKVFTAANGRDALEVWQKNKDHIQLLLTDVIMPDGMSGTELGGRLAIENPKLKIIYTSGHGQKALENTDRQHHTESFIQKPYSLQQIATLIRSRLDEPKAELLQQQDASLP